ncbi:hypothetical protein [Aeromicrobium wangtongii]|uniref:PH domain-containing protein n=1 Tax=Aeromicrobium wangtongii TaxID=2969247 RepID=A0ABY5M5V0_9ACTN|nr:hypothetical protein [Aeromicrobium wangtongii]MCD9198411.1 hypothetical protein [Aeromicrobium wangtongii]MCL3818904.1 hypothetical protein [Aeromicrobium wangtongii]UUP12441.1 hypothetical protein NQV15_11305 [Aeromicrobium wangtongii]
MAEAFEIHRRAGLYLLLALASLALAGGFAWVARDRELPLLLIPAVLFLALGLNHLRGLPDARTPLFVADDYGVRLRAGEGWVGLLWSEMGEIKVERREGVRHEPRIKVVSSDGQRFYTSPLGLATNVSPGEAEVQLAHRRSAASY